MDLLRHPTRPEPDFHRLCQQMGRARQRIVLLVEFFRVDFGLAPLEDPEGVVGLEVDESRCRASRAWMVRRFRTIGFGLGHSIWLKWLGL